MPEKLQEILDRLNEQKFGKVEDISNFLHAEVKKIKSLDSEENCHIVSTLNAAIKNLEKLKEVEFAEKTVTPSKSISRGNSYLDDQLYTLREKSNLYNYSPEVIKLEKKEEMPSREEYRIIIDLGLIDATDPKYSNAIKYNNSYNYKKEIHGNEERELVPIEQLPQKPKNNNSKSNKQKIEEAKDLIRETFDNYEIFKCLSDLGEDKKFKLHFEKSEGFSSKGLNLNSGVIEIS